MGMFGSDPMGGLPTYKKNTGLKTIFAIISIVFAKIVFNPAFNFFTLPESILKFENWIIFAGGILILIGMINLFRASKKYM